MEAPAVQALSGQAPSPEAQLQGNATRQAIANTPGNIPLQNPAAPTPPPAAGTQSVWKNLVMGAIYGLAGSAGATHFGGGLAGGAASVVQEAQQQFQNKQAAKQLAFESVRAADSHIAALDEHRRADQLSDETKVEYKQKSAEYQAYLQDSFGIEPDLSFNDTNENATAALTTGANKNGGTIPPIATVQHPSPDGEHGTVSVYSPSTEQMRANANGFRSLINTARAVQGTPDIDSPTFNSMGFKGQRDAAQAAINFLKPTPAFSLDKTKPDYLPNVLTQKQQQLEAYQNHKDANGKPDADPNVERQLQNGIDYLQLAWKNNNDMENKQSADQIIATAPAKAEAARQEDMAKQNTPEGQARLAQTYQSTIDAKYNNAEAHQKALFEQGVDPVTHEKLNLSNAPDEMLVDNRTGQPIPTKMLAVMKPSQQETNRADFASSVLHTLDVLDALKAAGKLPNGPIQGFTKQKLAKAGLGDKDAQEALNFISFAQSAATGAHVGGRFNIQIMDKMSQMIGLEMNNQQFQGAENAIRNVMTQYTQTGGRETVGMYKAGLIGNVVTLKNGSKAKVTGFDKNGQVVGEAVK
jgi:hypothetical protein